MFSSVEAAFYRSLLLFFQLFFPMFSRISHTYYNFFNNKYCYIKFNLYICNVNKAQNKKNKNYENKIIFSMGNPNIINRFN